MKDTTNTNDCTANGASAMLAAALLIIEVCVMSRYGLIVLEGL